jgi:hypothetical protein
MRPVATEGHKLPAPCRFDREAAGRPEAAAIVGRRHACFVARLAAGS